MTDIRRANHALALLGSAALLAVLSASCSSDGYSGSSSVSMGVGYYGGYGWYDDPFYGGYYPPGVIVVPPPGGGPDRPVSPEHPIAGPLPGGGASTLPAGPSTGDLPVARPTPSTDSLPTARSTRSTGDLPSKRSAPSASTRSSMPSAKPRTSPSSSRASIPRAPRGGRGGRRR